MGNNENISAKDFLAGAVVGGIIGAATALLFAPKSGKELRSELNDQAALVKDKTIEIRNTAITKGNEFIHLTKNKATEIFDTTVTKGNAFANAVKEKTNEWNNAAAENEKEGGQIESARKEQPAQAVPSADQDEAEAPAAAKKDSDSLQEKLAETKKAFDETEEQFHQK
ncbi:YtxH domain-containing protein [Bacillaceae bacterium Marseille-Q3522]|nr:YtxH domain-containing protein [Bacillaceae bacterium Marseille-Q3522]